MRGRPHESLGTRLKTTVLGIGTEPSAAGTAEAERGRRLCSTMYLKVYAFLDAHCKSRATKSVNISKHRDSNKCLNSLPRDNMQIAHETSTVYFSVYKNLHSCAVDAGDIYHTTCIILTCIFTNASESILAQLLV